MVVGVKRNTFLVNKLGRVAGLIWLAGGCKISNLFDAAADLLKRDAEVVGYLWPSVALA